MAETPMTGRPPEMLQDCDRKLSMALSNTPGARLHAREAASEVEAARASPADTRSERESAEQEFTLSSYWHATLFFAEWSGEFGSCPPIFALQELPCWRDTV